MEERYSAMMECFRGMYKAERERVLRDNRARKIKLTEDLERVTESLRLMENEHLLLVLKEDNKSRE